MVIRQLQSSSPDRRPVSIPAKSVILVPMSKYTKLRASLVSVPLSYIFLLLLPCTAGVLQSHTHRLDDHLHHLITTLCDRTLQNQNLKQADGLLLIPAKRPNALLVNTSLSTSQTSTDRLRDQS
jgi:hypothetical protein